MKPETMEKVLKLIAQADEDELKILYTATHERSKLLRRITHIKALRTFEVGDKVRLVDIRPKYMVGLRGTIIAHQGTKFLVELDNPINRGSKGRQWSKQLVVPPGCCQAI